MRRIVPWGIAGCGLLAGCWGSGEAADPRAILGDELETADEQAAPRRDDADQQGAPPPKLASATECRSAAENLVRLGLDLAIAEESDPERRRELEAERQRGALASPRAREHVETWTRECLERETRRAAAQCIEAARSEADIERCAALDT